MTGRDDEEAHWYEDETGPMVRPYTVTRGRTRPATEHAFDMMARVTAVGGAGAAADPRQALDHARMSLFELIRRGARPIVELAADADLPLAVVRVLLSDLLDAGLVRIGTRPAAHADQPDTELLEEVLEHLRRL